MPARVGIVPMPTQTLHVPSAAAVCWLVIVNHGALRYAASFVIATMPPSNGYNAFSKMR